MSIGGRKKRTHLMVKIVSLKLEQTLGKKQESISNLVHIDMSIGSEVCMPFCNVFLFHCTRVCVV